MKSKLKYLLLIIISFCDLSNIFAQRFPKPEFESGYEQLHTQLSVPRSTLLEYFDVLVLIIALSVITWFVIKKRSRSGVFWVTVFSVIYFGFYREGCICSVGSIQNIALAVFNPSYSIPLTAIAFFVIPLVFTLFFGRTFCAGVCPLGAIQDLFIWKPMKLSGWVQKLMGLIPVIYLSFAILYAATDTDFIICRYDPFVGVYRLGAEASMFILGAILLLTGIFIARPYCRFFCPYGVLLNWFSRISKYHMKITPTVCIQCKLCENSCPFGAIEKPEAIKFNEPKAKTIGRFKKQIIIIPLLIVVGILSGYLLYPNLAMVNKKVKLAKEIYYLENNPEVIEEPTYKESFEVEAFRSSGKSIKELNSEANDILDKFKIGSLWLGGFIGFMFGITLANLSAFRYRDDYEPNKGECLSCARCMDFCPVGDSDELMEKAM